MMEQKIRELAEQSGFFPVPDETEWDLEYRAENSRYEVFADLIIKECIEVIKRDMELNHIQMVPIDFKMYANNGLGRVIKEHFGIEL